MILRKRAQQFRHSRSKPAIAPPPEEWDIRSMKEKTIRLLQLVEISSHLQRGAVEITTVAGCAECLHLQNGAHVHIVDPETGFRSQAALQALRLHSLANLNVGRQALPLGISE